MGVIGSVVEAFTEKPGGEGTFGYRCVACETTFERAKRRMVQVRCPNCRSTNVRPANGADGAD